MKEVCKNQISGWTLKGLSEFVFWTLEARLHRLLLLFFFIQIISAVCV